MVAIGENEIRITADRYASMHSGWLQCGLYYTLARLNDSSRYAIKINRLPP